MPPKGTAKKGGSGAAKTATQKNRSKWPVHKSQPLPVSSPAIGEDSSDLDRTLGNTAETESGLTGVMDMLMEISSRLQATEHFMDEVKADKAAEATRREESCSCSQPATGISRGCTHRHHKSHQATTSGVVDI